MPDLHASTPATLKPATEPALARLYGAALGSVHAAYYLAVFDRFEALGRWRSSWNWTAATLTLNWLLFRQLWLAALVYGSFLLLVPLLVLGLGRYLFALPSSIELGLWLSFLLLGVVVPGLWGNALLYLDSQRRINQALAASATLEQACALLLRRASGRNHALGLMVGNALLVGLALAAYVGRQGATADLPDVAVTGRVVNEPVVAASKLRPASATISAASAAVFASASASAPASAPASSSATARVSVLVVASAPAPASASASAKAKAKAVIPASGHASATAVGRLVAASASASAVVASRVAAEVSARVPASATSSVQASAPARVASIARGGRTTGLSAYASAPWATRATSGASRPSAPASAAASTATVAASRPPAGRVFVNVGLFAQADNAQQVHARLVAAGLPALSDQINNAQGQQRTRVRVGPFASRAQAQVVVGRIKALKLDAVLAP